MPRPYWNLAIGLAPDKGQRLGRGHGPVAVPELAPVDRLPLPSSRPGAMESPQKAQCNGQPGREVARVELLSAFTVRGILGPWRVFGSPRACLRPFSYLQNWFSAFATAFWGLRTHLLGLFWAFRVRFFCISSCFFAPFSNAKPHFPKGPFCVLVSP